MLFIQTSHGVTTFDAFSKSIRDWTQQAVAEGVYSVNFCPSPPVWSDIAFLLGCGSTAQTTYPVSFLRKPQRATDMAERQAS